MYNVAILFERQLIELDADQIASLHEGVDDEITYHRLLPVAESQIAISASMAALGAGSITPIPDPETIETLEDAIRQEGEAGLNASLELFRARNMNATSALAEGDPLDELIDLVEQYLCDEAIILTEPHVVREFLHLDWTSRARRKLNVPTLHLLEGYTFSQQADI